MTENECGWSEWLSPGQPAGTPGVCAACGLTRGYGDVKRCMKQGRRQEAEASAHAIHSGIGDRLEAAFGKWLVTASGGCNCSNLRDKLNSMTAEQVKRWKRLPDLILGNVPHLSGPVGLIIRGLAALAPEFARNRVEAAIAEACQEAATRTAEDAAPDAPAPR